MKTKLLGMVLTLSILIGCLPCIARAEIIDSGTCGKDGGDNLTWTLDSEGTLTVSGEGEMGNFPWNFYGATVDYRPYVKNVVIGNGVVSVCSFQECENLTSVTLPETLTAIEAYAFNNCSSLTNIELPEALISIEEYAFKNCGLKSIYIPCNVETIGDGAFFGCRGCAIDVDDGNKSYSSLEGVLFNKDRTRLIAYTMDGENVQDKIYTVPEGVKTIGAGAFGNCSGLWGVVLPQSLVAIESEAFDCANLVWDLAIPKNVESIAADAFQHSGVKNFVVEEENKSFCSVDGVLFNKEKTELLAYPNWKADAVYAIPDGTELIGDYAFYGCGKAESILIPDSVSGIGKKSFVNTEKLTAIEIPDSVLDIGEEAFLYSALKTVRLGSGITAIKYRTFDGCRNMESIFIPQSVLSIDYGCFDYCGKLSYVYYGGNKEDWTEITVDSDNTSLTDAEIFYNVAGDTPPEITQFNTKTDADGTRTVDISLKSVNRVEYLIVGLYNGDTLAEVKSIRLIPNDAEKSITVGDDSITTVKAFIWDNLNGMKPLCEAKSFTITQ